jgi:glucose-1-phosphate thymidylyltransferase
MTYTSAKQLLPVGNKPVLFYGLEAIRDAGITDVGIVVDDTAPAIRSAVGGWPELFRAECHVYQIGGPLGLAHAVLVARDFSGDDDFVMYLGDNFIVGDITELVEEVPIRSASRSPAAIPPAALSRHASDLTPV